MMNYKTIWKASWLVAVVLLAHACGPDPIDDDGMGCQDRSCGDLTGIPCDPQEYIYNIPEGLPLLPTSVTKNTTVEGIALGRRLFYDPILSADSTMACASCHLAEGSFTDNLAVSTGIDEIEGTRSSMSLLNVGYYDTGLFWDGRSANLEEQALLPVEDPIEMHNTWPNVMDKLKAHPTYPNYFREAFCIEHIDEMTKEQAASAIAQFESIFISSGNSKYDRVIRGETSFSDEELAGWEMFFDTSDDIPQAECGHCHNPPLFTTNEYFNNGLTAADDFDDFPDPGLGAITGEPTDMGHFRTPTLRNITASAPYMHDGRFETLKEVLNHYNAGGEISLNKNEQVLPLFLTEEQIDNLIAFIKTLDDPDFMNNEELHSPF